MFESIFSFLQFQFASFKQFNITYHFFQTRRNSLAFFMMFISFLLLSRISSCVFLLWTCVATLRLYVGRSPFSMHTSEQNMSMKQQDIRKPSCLLNAFSFFQDFEEAATCKHVNMIRVNFHVFIFLSMSSGPLKINCLSSCWILLTFLRRFSVFILCNYHFLLKYPYKEKEVGLIN